MSCENRSDSRTIDELQSLKEIYEENLHTEETFNPIYIEKLKSTIQSDSEKDLSQMTMEQQEDHEESLFIRINSLKMNSMESVMIDAIKTIESKMADLQGLVYIEDMKTYDEYESIKESCQNDKVFFQNAFEKAVNYHRKYMNIYEDVSQMILEQQQRIENKINSFWAQGECLLMSLGQICRKIRDIKSKQADLQGKAIDVTASKNYDKLKLTKARYQLSLEHYRTQEKIIVRKIERKEKDLSQMSLEEQGRAQIGIERVKKWLIGTQEQIEEIPNKLRDVELELATLHENAGESANNQNSETQNNSYSCILL